MAKVYEGERPFIFVSYAHENKAVVNPFIKAFEAAGYRVWYDERIDWSEEWTSTIADHLHLCSHFLAFVSPDFAGSPYCRNEVNLAIAFGKTMLVAYIEDFDLFQVNSGLFYQLSNPQAKFRHQFDSDEDFISYLISQEALEPCLHEYARARNNAIKAAHDVLSRSASDDDALHNVLYTLRELPNVSQNDEVRQCISQIEDHLSELAVEREKRKQQETRDKAIGIARVVLTESQDDERALKDALSALRALPEVVRDEGTERYVNDLEDRLRLLEVERALHEQMERDRSNAIESAKTALYSHGDDDDALWNALHKLNRIPNLERYPDAKGLASKINDRLADLEEERKRRDQEVRAYSDAIYAAWSALKAPVASESDLQDALSALGNLSSSVRDQTVETCSRLIESRLRQLQKDSAVLEGQKRKETRAKVIGAATEALNASNQDKIELENALTDLRGLDDIDGDSEVKRLIADIEGRLDRLAAEEVRRAQGTSKAETTKSTPKVVPKNLSEYSWAELKAIADRIAAARTDSEGLEIAKAHGLVDLEGKLRGDTKPVTLTNGRQASIRIVGFRHDDRADSKGKAGITFEFADVPVTHAMNPPSGLFNAIFGSPTNAGGWRGSNMRTYLNESFRSLLPSELSSRIVQVKKRANNRGGDVHNDASVVTVTEDGLWLLSMSEVYGRLSGQPKNVPTYPSVYDAEGTQYKLYADQGVSIANYGFCKKSGASSWWWLRSPSAYDSHGFRYVSSGGYWNGDYADKELGVSPGFCF